MAECKDKIYVLLSVQMTECPTSACCCQTDDWMSSQCMLLSNRWLHIQPMYVVVTQMAASPTMCMLLSHRWLQIQPIYVVVTQMTASLTRVCCCHTDHCMSNPCMLLSYRWLHVQPVYVVVTQMTACPTPACMGALAVTWWMTTAVHVPLASVARIVRHDLPEKVCVILFHAAVTVCVCWTTPPAQCAVSASLASPQVYCHHGRVMFSSSFDCLFSLGMYLTPCPLDPPLSPPCLSAPWQPSYWVLYNLCYLHVSTPWQSSYWVLYNLCHLHISPNRDNLATGSSTISVTSMSLHTMTT